MKLKDMHRRKPMKKIVFYNFLHNGDIHVSREYVRWIVKNLPQYQCFYQHNNSPKLLADIDNLQHIPLKLDKKKWTHAGWTHYGDTLFANTWYKAKNGQYFDGCHIYVIDALFRKELLQTTGVNIPNPTSDFIPQIDYKRFPISNIDAYFRSCPYNKRIFISNNKVLSGQAANFDFDPIVDQIASKFKDVLFLLTNETKIKGKNNVIQTKEIIKINENDLIENAYLSTFCQMIVGRSSGAHTFAMANKSNMNKIHVSFCNNALKWAYSFGLHTMVNNQFFNYDYRNAVEKLSHHVHEI